MQYVDYIEIENFKGIGPLMRVPLANPGVIVGPNNSGKTTVLQALSLWGRAVFEWWDAKAKGRLEKDGTVVVNRLAYLHDRKGQVVLIDEPDAHLEVLRQRQAFAILREVADKTRTQIVMVTHSEIILDEAYETNLVSLAHTHVADLALRTDIRTTLRNIGVQHYCNAELKKRLLIVEGSTDVAMLREFARILYHPVFGILNDTIFSFYTQESNADVIGTPPVEQYETEGLDYRRFYSALKRLIPELRAVALFDSDGRETGDTMLSEDFKILRWRRYEFENYFITPERIEEYILLQKGKAQQPLIRKAVDEVLAEMVFDANADKVSSYYQVTEELRENLLAHTKMSLFAERVFRRLADLSGSPIVLNKGEFFKLIGMLKKEDVPVEVVQRLDAIYEILQPKVDQYSGEGQTVDAINEIHGAINAERGAVNGRAGAVNQRHGAINDDDRSCKACEDRIYSTIKGEPGINGRKLAQKLNLGTSTVDRAVARLKAASRIEYRGSNKTGGYYVL